MPLEIVISVSGGVVETVHCSQPAIVTVIDWDAEPPDYDVPGFVRVEAANGHALAFVSRSGVLSTADVDPVDAKAIHLAEERGIISLVEGTPTCSIPHTRDLATVLAALRYWQIALEKSGASICQRFPHFEREDPLTTAEIDQLCERLNFGEPDIHSEEAETWRTTWAPRSGSAEPSSGARRSNCAR